MGVPRFLVVSAAVVAAVVSALTWKLDLLPAPPLDDAAFRARYTVADVEAAVAAWAPDGAPSTPPPEEPGAPHAGDTATRPVALVTGAARGIGAAFADRLGAAGFDLILVSRRASTLDPTAQRIRRTHGVRVDTVVAEFARGGEQDAVHAVIAAADASAIEGRPVTLYVNNHAATNLLDSPLATAQSSASAVGSRTHDATVRRRWHDEPLEVHLELLDVNYVSAVVLTHHFAKRFVAQGTGAIVLVSSTSALKPMPWLAQYGSTKAALTSLGRSLTHELAPLGVDVLTANVGATDTPSLRTAMTARALEVVPTLSAAEVVEETLANVGRRATVIPGLANKVQEWVLGSVLTEHGASMVLDSFMTEYFPTM